MSSEKYQYEGPSGEAWKILKNITIGVGNIATAAYVIFKGPEQPDTTISQHTHQELHTQ